MEDFDPVRCGEWMHAVDEWQRGDVSALVAFVKTYGIQTEGERQGIVQMLTTKPDARRVVKKHTEVMLREVDTLVSKRRWIDRHFAPYFREWFVRLRRRLAARGLTDEQIDALLQRRRPGWTCTPKLTMAEIYSTVARRHGVDADAVQQAHKRHRRR